MLPVALLHDTLISLFATRYLTVFVAVCHQVYIDPQVGEWFNLEYVTIKILPF